MTNPSNSAVQNLLPVQAYFDLQGNFIKDWDSATQAGKLLNLDDRGINTCCRGKQKTAFGFIWKFKDNLKNGHILKKL